MPQPKTVGAMTSAHSIVLQSDSQKIITIMMLIKMIHRWFVPISVDPKLQQLQGLQQQGKKVKEITKKPPVYISLS